ncbi:MAG: hypothetical protein ACR2MT_02465 [Aurantibacter sp.]
MEKKSAFSKFVKVVWHFTTSFKNFFKSSFISLVVIGIILLLLTQMDQAFTMMVDLVEGNPFSLFLSFFFINALALVLSHYPIYTYYAADLNNSGDYTKWREVTPIEFWPFKYFPVYIYYTDEKSDYRPDNLANYFRYATGWLIHAVWIHFIISSFRPNIIFEKFDFSFLEATAYALMIVPFAVYIYLKERIVVLERKKDPKASIYSEEEVRKAKIEHRKFYGQVYLGFVVITTLSFLLLGTTLILAQFSPSVFLLLVLTSYMFMLNYIYFRFLRSNFHHIFFLRNNVGSFNPFMALLKLFAKLENYILLFNFNFLIALVLLVYSTLASIFGWALFNGIPILLGFLYFYYFIIASLGRYYFVARKISTVSKSRRYRAIFVAGCTLALLLFVTNCANVEVTTHELDLVENTKTEIQEQQFVDSLRAKKDNTLFFIASHGGGLKANVWTLNVLNSLQKRTEGKLLDQTIALSGASGGSLGLALYTGLYKEHGLDTASIQDKIDDLAQQNYTSLDLTLTFGMDTYRKMWPLNQRIGLRDRPYYAMVKYQRKIRGDLSGVLDTTSFRDYWKEAFNLRGYFPSLIMNTAATNGSRGLLWSVKQKDFGAIFPYAINLADLQGNKTLPYYQAVSTTNRFPVFSPAAKIPGLGHYVDAGAVDNSGLLGCLDLHNYLLRNKNILQGKQIAYIEIINNKTLYIDHLVDQFKKENNLQYIYKNEFEADNIIVDLKTGLNLDKIPGYLSDYLSNWEQAENGKLRYFKIFMPHKVCLDDVESYFGGEIANDTINVKHDLKNYLEDKNKEILNLTEKERKSFFDPWQSYEPTLSRHLSKSSLRYVSKVLKHPLLEEQFWAIDSLIKTQKIEKNKNMKIRF